MDDKKIKQEEKIEKKKKFKKEYIVFSIIVILIILIDQISKIVISNLGEIVIISDVFKFGVTQNNSAAYGIGSNSKIMYIITNLIILSVIFKFMTTQNEFIDTKLKVFLSFIFAGGISNTIDKIFRGYVIEFIDFKQVINIPVLNIADIFILIGWVSVAAIFASFTVIEWRKNKKIENKIDDEDKKKG